MVIRRNVNVNVWNSVGLPENVVNSMNCFKLTKITGVFRPFVMILCFTLRNHDIATEICYVKNQGYSSIVKNYSS